MKFQTIAVTPDIAKDWLKKNPSNRAVRPTYVKQLAASMKRGEWATNHQAIAINGSRLIDGQHRLMAVIQSGLPSVKMSVVTDADVSTFDTIDIGAKRSNADIYREKNDVMTPINFVGRLIYGQRLTPRTIGPVYMKFRRPVTDIAGQLGKVKNKLTSTPVKVAALAAILEGEDKDYIYGLLKNMAEFKTAKLPPVCQSFVQQITLGQKGPGSGSGKQHDVLVRAWTAFHKANADLDQLRVKRVHDRLDKIRQILSKEIGIK